jgi:hypothetical protein
MAYAPGVQNRSGEFMAQGLMQASQGIAQGIQKYYQRKEEKEQTEQAKAAFKGILQANPQMGSAIGLQDLNDDKALTAAVKTFGNPREAIMFAGAVQQYSQQQQEMAQQEEFRRKLQTMSQLDQGVGQGVLRPEVLQRYQRDMQNPVMQDSVALYGATGQVPSTGQLSQLIATRAAQQGREAPGMEVVKIREADAQGNPVEVTYDKRSGREIARGPVSQQPRPVLSPEEEAQKVQLVGRTQNALKFNDAIAESGQEAARLSTRYDRALQLLDTTYTGPGAELAANAKRWAGVLGFDAKSVGSFEELQNIIGDSIMQRVNQTKGAISDKEMRLFELWSASTSKTPDGNKAILRGAKAVAEREREMSRLVQKLRKAGKNELEIQAEVADFATKLQEEKPLFSEADEGLLSGSTAAWDDAREKRLRELQKKLGK